MPIHEYTDGTMVTSDMNNLALLINDVDVGTYTVSGFEDLEQMTEFLNIGDFATEGMDNYFYTKTGIKKSILTWKHYKRD